MSIQDPNEAEERAYQDATLAIHDKYTPRVLKLLREWKKVLRTEGIPSDKPVDCSTDDFQWGLTAKPRGKAQVGIDIELTESLGFDGTTEGVNWMVTIVEDGGRVLGQFCQHNFTPEVWTMDEDEIEARFIAIGELSLVELVSLVNRAAAAA